MLAPARVLGGNGGLPCDPPAEVGHLPAAADERVDELVNLAEVVRHLAERLQGGLKPAGERVQDLARVLADTDAPFGVPDPFLRLVDGGSRLR